MEELRALREAIRRYAWVVLDMGFTNGSGRCPAEKDISLFKVRFMLRQTAPVYQDMHLYEVQEALHMGHLEASACFAENKQHSCLA